MISAPVKKGDCSCHRHPRLGGTTDTSDFADWLSQQPADTQALYYSYQAANPGSPVVASPAGASSTAVNWTLAIVAGIGAILLLETLTGGGRKR